MNKVSVEQLIDLSSEVNVIYVVVEGKPYDMQYHDSKKSTRKLKKESLELEVETFSVGTQCDYEDFDYGKRTLYITAKKGEL